MAALRYRQYRRRAHVMDETTASQVELPPVKAHDSKSARRGTGRISKPYSFVRASNRQIIKIVFSRQDCGTVCDRPLRHCRTPGTEALAQHRTRSAAARACSGRLGGHCSPQPSTTTATRPSPSGSSRWSATTATYRSRVSDLTPETGLGHGTPERCAGSDAAGAARA